MLASSLDYIALDLRTVGCIFGGLKRLDPVH